MRTIPPLVLGLLLVTVLFPALLLVALAVDLARRVAFGVPPMAARLLAFLWVQDLDDWLEERFVADSRSVKS